MTQVLWSAIIIIATNIAYLLPALLACSLRVYDVAAAHFAVFLASNAHHVCFDLAKSCYPALRTALQHLDVTIAYYSVARDIMFVASYDIIQVKGRSKIVRHTYTDFATVLYDAIIVFAVFYFGNSLTASMLVVGYGLLVIGSALTFYWNMKKQTFKQRFNWVFIGLAVLSGVVGSLLFVFEDEIGRPFHSLWHIFGALTSHLLLLGSSNHIKRKGLGYFGCLFARQEDTDFAPRG